eukprot:9325697-Alexandrium_andersonii.AAC.1
MPRLIAGCVDRADALAGHSVSALASTPDAVGELAASRQAAPIFHLSAWRCYAPFRLRRSVRSPSAAMRQRRSLQLSCGGSVMLGGVA